MKKTIHKLNNLKSEKRLVHNLKNFFFNLNEIHNNFNYRFVLKTNYLRSYWLSNDKKIRATIDTNLVVNPINDLNRKLELNETILEFKFSQTDEKLFRNLFFQKQFNLRSKKYSKYLQSFNLLEDSGLIDFSFST